MFEMTLTSKNQLTFNKSILEHLGVKAGEKITIKKLKDGSIHIDASKKRSDIMKLAGALKSDTNIKMSIEDMNNAIAQGYRKNGLKGLQ